MCGIAGLANCGNRDVLSRMTRVQAHRGPDDSGLWERRFPDGSCIGLGSRRLAILDLTAGGHMPMSNEDGSIWITFNGEIYNFAELRRELESKGHQFSSHTDTETIIHLYEEEGIDCVRRLNGMFAFAICDLRSGAPELFLARDHFGVKPLYYWQQSGRFAFASEVKALLQVPQIEAELDLESLHQYLTFLWVPDPKTMFRGIFKLPAGHYAVFRGGELKIGQYWDLEFPSAGTAYPRSEADLADELRQRFRQSVERQMVSDVPLGAFLSAGLDSSSIVAMMRRATHQPVRTYTITFPQKYRVGETALDDPAVPARLARQLGCENEQIVVEPDVADLLPRLTWHMDEPTADPAIIAAYLVCREARKQATVLLSGVGGDELFAGYRKHAAQKWANAYKAIPGAMRHALEAGVNALPGMRGTRLKGFTRLAKKMARSASLAPEESFIRNCTYLDAVQKDGLYKEDVRSRLESSDPSTQHHASFATVRHADFLNQMLYLDTKIFMVSLNLNYNDKMSMASSVEVRVPFLDRELAEFAASQISPELKLKGFLRPTTKHIFRRAMHGILPEEVLRQPKAGFAAPVDYWLAHDLREMVDDLLSETNIRRRGLFRPEAVRRLVTEHRSGAEDWSMQIWQFLTLENWMRVFLDNGAQRSAEDFGQPREAATA
ncbi:MAG TPA: asparagine synthase (glutamine-hydrolyzing) [Candidatus Binatia bacterium]|nr:asparagine synthase (glutamine-hydrolyzing) [Candidatus Binatia bacterium]